MFFAGCFVLSLYIGWLKKASGNVWNGGGMCPARHWLFLPLWCPAGACFVCRPPTLPLACFSAPYPPSPRSQSALPRWGRGRIKVFLCKGLRPLHPRGLLRAALARRASAVPCGGRTGDGRRLALPPHVPGGGVPFSSPANPAFSVVSAPYPPAPLPRRGRGSPKVYFAGGFAPGTPALDRSRHLQTFPNRSPAQRGVRGWSPEWQEMLFLDSAGSQGEGGPGEMKLSVASDGGV